MHYERNKIKMLNTKKLLGLRFSKPTVSIYQLSTIDSRCFEAQNLRRECCKNLRYYRVMLLSTFTQPWRKKNSLKINFLFRKEEKKSIWIISWGPICKILYTCNKCCSIVTKYTGVWNYAIMNMLRLSIYTSMNAFHHFSSWTLAFQNL